MNPTFGILTVVFIIISAAMVLVILVQRPTGGGLAGAFGGAGGGGTDTVFGGRVGDALTVITVIGFVLWLGLAVSLNLVETESTAQPATQTSQVGDPESGLPTTPSPVDGANSSALPTTPDSDADDAQQPE